jgi:hypothetical protein
LGVATVLDIVKEAVRSRIVDWILTHLGHLGRLLMGNPFFLLTVALIGVGVWVLWVVVKTRFISESAIVGSKGEKLYRPEMSTRFVAGTFTVTLLSLSCAAYGAYRYYAVPVPLVVGVEDTWFKEHFKNSDVYLNVNLKNYGDRQVTVKIDPKVLADGRVVDYFNQEDMAPSYTIAPGAKHGIHFPLQFSWDGLAHAYGQDKITVTVNVAYNDGTRDVTYRYEGRFVWESVHNCPVAECPGNVDVLRSEWD